MEAAPGGRYLLPANRSGRYININDHRRRTTDAPDGAVNRVHFFGGSTLFCAEVPDQWTVASCLQRLLNEQPGPRLRVENYGACSMIARQQTEQLQARPIRPGDVVIFYDGFNDVYYPIYNGNPDGWRPGDDQLGGEHGWAGCSDDCTRSPSAARTTARRRACCSTAWRCSRRRTSPTAKPWPATSTPPRPAFARR